MVNLDNTQIILQRHGMEPVLRSMEELPLQLDQAFNDIQELQFADTYRDVHNIVLCGMGGSRFPGYIVRELFKNHLRIPFEINDDYNLPAHVNEKTLVILSSYSGSTEEIIVNTQKAKKAHAQVVGITTGGTLKKILLELQTPVYVFDPVYNPSQQPRIGFGYAIGALMGLLIHLGLVDYDAEKIQQAYKSVQKYAKDYTLANPQDGNPAKHIASTLVDRYPYFVVSEFITGIGNAMQNQINETAKAISSFRIIPELNHHLMEGLKFPETHRNMATFVFLHSPHYSQRIKQRFVITKEVVEQNNVQSIWYDLRGDSEVENALDCMIFGSYLSLYLSILYEQDPNAVPFVDYFKKRLKEI